MAIQDIKMCECGCVVEERSRDTGEWWNYCNDCYEKDQDEEEERPLCRNCEIETRKHCDDCGGYGYEKDQADDETFICDECDHDLDWSLYVYFKESYDKRGEPYHPDDGGCPHRCINCHNDIVCERIIKFIDELK